MSFLYLYYKVTDSSLMMKLGELAGESDGDSVTEWPSPRPVSAL